ncbi:MAG: 5-oxoprolinase subunit PxpA [Winogradskyella sp.]|uniref:5-oxoprolinase subunit PxpA n=1 Tax=Winogradskyella sp. TaxID=1883156 RepID=UPI003858E071
MKKLIYIDLNADVGEGFGNELELMPFLSSCNIACGGHAGDLQTMMTVVKLAKSNNVKIGAHPSFPDKANFGRLPMEISHEELYTNLLAQILDLEKVARIVGMRLNHVKPHGALYNLAAKDIATAKIIVTVIKSLNDSALKLYAPYNSEIAKIAKQENIEVIFEGFADRNYNDDLSLVSRKNNHAILHEKEAVLNHVLHMIVQQKITTFNSLEVPIKVDTICVHGDTKNAVEILKFLNQELLKNGIKIQ